MSNLLRDAIRDQVLKFVATRWRRIHGDGVLGRLISPLYCSRRVIAIFLVEYESIDETSMCCEGDVVSASRQDSEGLRDVDTIAAMACAIWGAASGLDALPPEWLEQLEQRDRLQAMARSLAEAAGNRPTSGRVL